MKRFLLTFVTAVAGNAVGGAVGSYCPDSNLEGGPNPKQCTPLGSFVGDPVSIVDGYTLHDETDFSMQTSFFKLNFMRRYISRNGTWDQSQRYLHPPFGTYGVYYTRWNHTFYSYITRHPTQPGPTHELFQFRKQSGRYLEFDCATYPGGTAGWATHWNGPWPLEEIWCDLDSSGQKNGFRVFDNETGQVLEYRAKFFDTLGTTYPYYYLSTIGPRQTTSSSTQLTGKISINYATPVLPDGGTIAGGCVMGGAGGTSDPGVPYIQTVVSDEGEKAWFTYEKMSNECVLKQVGLGHTADGGLGGAAPVVTYEYSGNGMLSGIKRHRTSSLSESYTYTLNASPSYWQYAPQNGVPLVKHTYNATCDAVGTAETPTEKLTFNWGGAFCNSSETGFPGSAAEAGYPRVVTNDYAGKGNGQSGAAGMSTKYWATRSYLAHQGRFGALQSQGACTPAEACSTGAVTMLHPDLAGAMTSPRSLGGQSMLQAAIGKQDVTQYTDVAGTSGKRWEKTAAGWSVNSDAGMPASCAAGQSCEWYTYTYSVPWSMQMPASTLRNTVAAGFSPAQVGTTTSYDSATARPKVVTRTGNQMKLLAGNLVTVSTFYFSRDQTCTGGGFLPDDPLGRVVEIHGPCAPDISGTDCQTGIEPFPVTKYTYFGSASGTNSNRLASVTRYTNGCPASYPSSTALTKVINAYDVAGNVTSFTDENGFTTTMSYDRDGRMLSRNANGLTTNFSYKYGELEWVQYPEGNYEVYGHLDGSGLWTPLLQWKAKASNSSGTSWSEKVDYVYWPDGTVKTETYSSRDTSGTTEVRQTKQFAADGHKRPTYEAFGNTPSFNGTKRFDANNNVTGIGFPYNAAPTFCSGNSKKCSDLEYDAWNRLAKLTQYPQSTSTPGIESRFCHDANGNLTAVAPGSTSANFVCVNGQGSGTYLDKSFTYEYDDFGNVTAVTQPNASGGATGRSVTRYEYDVRGNVVKKQTAAQATSAHTLYTYDTMDRLLESRVFLPGVGYGAPSYTFSYDNTVGGPNANCPQPTNTLGRLKRIADSGGYVFMSYDAWGRVVREQRVRTLTSSCTAPIDDHPATVYTYSNNGNLLTMTYPHGRLIQYLYKSTNGANDRVDKVQLWAQLAWQGWVDVVRKIEWEPYGGLRGYELAFSNGNSAGLEYYLGGDTSTLPTTGSTCPTLSTALTGGNDSTGRLRALWLSNGLYSKGSTSASGDIYKRLYTWKADQVARIDTCTLNSNSVREDYGPSLLSPDVGYDQLLRLSKVRAPLLATSGGPVRQRNYSYDDRSNRTGDIVDEFGSNYVYSYSATSYQPDLLTRHKASLSSSLAWRDYTYDRDGRVTTITNPNVDSQGTSPLNVTMGYNLEPANGGTDSVFRSVTKNGATYTYYYDPFNRRRLKGYPTGVTDEFFYSSNGLIEDRGSYTTSTFAPYPIDEYIWLAGRPVAVYRSNFNSSWVRTYDFQGSCQRNGIAADCGLYFIVTDHMGKPTLMLNSLGNVSGVGEYDPFGAVNRVPAWGETYHPYYHISFPGMLFMDVTQPTNGLSMKMRFHFMTMDVEPNLPTCNTGGDWVRIKDAAGTNLASYQGFHRGQMWSDWVTPTAPAGRALIYMETSNATNKAPAFCGSTWPYTGASIREYEYQRYNTSQPFWTPLRFPGQYYDEETDLFENWNRYYEPLTGRYLQPEPMMLRPAVPAFAGTQGRAMQSYEYAYNNPVSFTDPSGLMVEIDASCARYPEWVDKALSPLDPHPSNRHGYAAFAGAVATVGRSFCITTELSPESRI